MRTVLSVLGRRLASRWWVIGVPYAWLLFFFLVPFLIVIKISLSGVGDRHPALCADDRSG